MAPSDKVTVPARTAVLVIGGGPAGSYVATVLKREGLDVVLLEAAQFPRYHVGEGMLPSMRHYLKYIDCEDLFDKHGFTHRPGACFKLRQDLRETYADFNALGPSCTSWNLIRSESDELLLNHAERQGVQVFQSTRVNAIEFEGDPATSRPLAAQWANKEGHSGSITFDWLVDASGRAGIMSTKYLKNRQFRESLRNVAVWGYWKDVKIYQEGTARSNAPWFEGMNDGQGWAWSFSLHDGTTSIGIVMHQDSSNQKKRERPGGPPSLREHYVEQLNFLPGVLALIGDKGTLVEGSVHGSVDYSYEARRYSGDHFRLVGDAASFVDPFFASGVHIAMTGALSAATTICASIKQQVDEKQAQLWHDAKIGISHTRYLLVILGAYKQMKQPYFPILSNVDDDNFDRAFAAFRPVISGLSDASENLNDEQINGTIDFCTRIFDPSVSLENLISVRQRYNPEEPMLSGPLPNEKDIEEFAPGDEEAQKVIMKLKALKALRAEVDSSTLENDGLNDLVAHTARGSLGLSKIVAA